MLILHKVINEKRNPGILIAPVFGVGLIGLHLVHNLYKFQYKTLQTLPFAWQPTTQRKKEITDILYSIRDIAKGCEAKYRCRIDFVWCAGKGGFTMAQSETQPELDSFSEVVEMALDVQRKNPSWLVRFHMVSSAGGLFEGQRNVSADSLTAPRRPYGYLKLKQEKTLESCDELVRIIYRPASVYGFVGLNRRMGLIPTLLLNGSQNKVCTLFGAPETLRDYIWADDVGTFMASMIASGTLKNDRFLLASGKPSALFEVIHQIERLLKKKLFCHYLKNGENVEHNTFSITISPSGWKPLDLTTGIQKTYYCMAFNIYDK